MTMILNLSELCPYCIEYKYKNSTKTFILVRCSKYGDNKGYGMNDYYNEPNTNPLRPIEIKLFTKLNNYNKNEYKLIIRLAKRGTLNRNTKIIDAQKLFKGFLIIIYINKQDTLQDIIDKYVSNIDGITIEYTYHLKRRKRIISIRSNKRSFYYPYKKFLRDRPNDLIIVTVLATNDNEKVLCNFTGNWFKI